MAYAAKKVPAKDPAVKLGHRRKTVLELVDRLGIVTEACRCGGIDRTSYWQRLPRSLRSRSGNGAHGDARIDAMAAVPHGDGDDGSERVGPKHRGGTAVRYSAGIDVSLEESSVCVVDGEGRLVPEVKALSEPEALAALLGSLKVVFERIGREAGPLSQWLHAGLERAGLPVVLSRHGTSKRRCRR